jgi:mono/diheme cytochrome c family protein
MKNQIFIISLLLVGCFALVSMNVIDSNFQDPWEVPDKYVKMENPYAGDADADNIGRGLYAKHCKSCHGSKGKGDGTKAESLDTEIGDFTDGSLKDQTDGALYYKTYTGRDDMPGFQKKISDEKEQWLVINYLRKLSE